MGKVYGQGDQNEQKQRGIRKHPLLGGIRLNSALQGHRVKHRTQGMRPPEGGRLQFTEDFVASAEELELDALVSLHNNCI